MITPYHRQTSVLNAFNRLPKMFSKMLSSLLLCVFVLVSVTSTHCSSPVANTTLKFFSFGYAVYKPGWSFDQDGSLRVWFKTQRRDAMLLYEDDSGEDGQFVDVFLVKGKLRLRMAIGDCSYEERTVNGSFADSKWHKLVLRREGQLTTVSVDNVTTNPVKCSAQFSTMAALYAGFLSLVERDENSWVFPTAFWQSLEYGFQGCIRGVTYTVRGMESRPKLRLTNQTRPGCSNPCIGLKCRRGGKCINRILTAECDCKGTGYDGKHCARVIKVPTTQKRTTPQNPSTPAVEKARATTKPKPKGAVVAHKRNMGVHHGVSLWSVALSTSLTAAYKLS